MSKAWPLIVSLLLAACGGGGGGSGSSSSSSSSGGAPGNLTLSLSTNAVDFLGFAPGAGSPAPQTLSGSVSGTGSGTLYVLVSSSSPAVANVGPVNVGTNSASADIIPGAINTLGPGLHTATITVRACLNDSSCNTNQINGSPKTVTVNYRIDGTQSSTNSLAFDIGNAPQSADLMRAFSVASYPVNGWTATTDLPMLDVTPGTGGTALLTQVNASISPAALDAFAGGTYTGFIRFTPTVLGLQPFDLPVSINITRTRVNFVAPHVAIAGTVNDVIIRGESFNAAPPSNVLFGATPASSFTVVSDSEIHATHPALPEGAHTVHVVNAQGIDRTTAVLHAVSGGALPADSLEYPDGDGAAVFALLHDARRGALLVQLFYPANGTASNQLVRYAYSGGQWQQTERIMLPYRSAIALSANGESLYVAHGAAATFTVEERDPVSLAVTRTTQAESSFHEGFSMAVANDGNAMIQTNSSTSSTVFQELLYSPLRRSIRPMIRPNGRVTIPPMQQDSGFTAASSDGSTVLIADDQNQLAVRYVSGDLETQWFDPTLTVRAYFTQLVMNRRGTLLVSAFDGVYDSDFSLVGRLPNSSRGFGVSPEAPRAYVFDTDATLRVFDTSAPPVNGFLAEITPAITPAADPGIVSTTAQIVLSPDGSTAFIAGSAAVVVQPLP